MQIEFNVGAHTRLPAASRYNIEVLNDRDEVVRDTIPVLLPIRVIGLMFNDTWLISNRADDIESAFPCYLKQRGT